MEGFIVYTTYKLVDNKTQVQLFGRLENGQSFCTLNTVRPYFFIEKRHLLKAKPLLTKFTLEETRDKTFAGEPVLKVSHEDHTELNKIASVLHKKSIDTYESDIKPQMRFLIDNDILGSVDIEGEYTTADRVDRVYTEPTIKRSTFVPKLKTLSLDVESDKHNETLFCIGLYGEEIKQVFVVGDKKLKNAVSCKTEEECLEKVKKKIVELDPDIITGWNIADFDFEYLKRLYEKHSMSFDIGRDNSEVRLRLSEDFFKKSTVTIAGRQVLDGLYMVRDPFIKEAPSIRLVDFDSWTLEDVSQAILNEGKLLTGKDRHEEIQRMYYENDHQKLVDYNLQDCKLAYDILKKTQTIELAVERSQLTGMSLDRITASIAAFDSLYIREARKQHLVSPSTRYREKEERIKGGYVMESKAGIFENLLVLDFKSLYPSIIRTFNIDPASFLEKKEKGAIEAPNKAYFKNTDGILPCIIEKLHQAREKAKREERELATYAIKIIMNSFFGVLANPNCRYFSLDMANAITHFAQFIIKLTAQKIEEKGYKVIYSDTDSVFIDTQASKAEAQKIGKELQAYVNAFYDKYIQENYKRKSFLEIEFKRHYLAFLLPPVRHGDAGSKKRYAGLVEKNGKEDIEIVGLEAIRGDWTEAAQEFQIELLDKIFHKDEFVAFIRNYVKKLKQGKLDEKLVYTKSLRKGLDEYTKTTPPHVKAARKLPGEIESNIIKYYITTDGPEPVQALKHELDYEHYIEKQIAPIANTILFFFNKKFDEIIKDSKQTKLFS